MIENVLDVGIVGLFMSFMLTAIHCDNKCYAFTSFINLFEPPPTFKKSVKIQTPLAS